MFRLTEPYQRPHPWRSTAGFEQIPGALYVAFKCGNRLRFAMPTMACEVDRGIGFVLPNRAFEAVAAAEIAAHYFN
jgi:hypothetical protein